MSDDTKPVRLGGNDLLDVERDDSYPLRNRQTEERILHKVIADPRAEMARDLIRAWGMVAAKPGGEDSTGRATLEVMSVEMVLERAFRMTEQAFEEMEKRRWLVHLTRPPVED